MNRLISSLLEFHRENMSSKPSFTLTDCTLNVGTCVPKCGPLGPVGGGGAPPPPSYGPDSLHDNNNNNKNSLYLHSLLAYGYYKRILN